MLGHNDVIATIPVLDMQRARVFYEDTLGLALEKTTGDYSFTFRAGDTRIVLYKAIAMPITPTVVATWAVEDMLEAMVLEMRDKGVEFEHFEKEGFIRTGDIYQAEGFKCALFKDPDGNLLTLFQTQI